MVDGDDLRALTANADYSAAGREANIRRAQDIALYLNEQGQVAIVAVVAPFRWLRGSSRRAPMSRKSTCTPRRCGAGNISTRMNTVPRRPIS